MARVFKKGLGHLLAIFLVIAAIGVIFASPAKRYIYLIYQNAGHLAGVNLNNIASLGYVSFIKLQTGQFETGTAAVWLNRKINYNAGLADAKVLGVESPPNDNKWIEINLSEQKLYMKDGASTVGSFLVSTGKWAPTPTGQWRIWTKLRYARMTGGSKVLGTFYDLPNVPYTMYYYSGYGIHGAYWHNNFGQRMSHGCVNMRPEEAGIVFNWADVGTRVVVHN